MPQKLLALSSLPMAKFNEFFGINGSDYLRKNSPILQRAAATRCVPLAPEYSGGIVRQRSRHSIYSLQHW